MLGAITKTRVAWVLLASALVLLLPGVAGADDAHTLVVGTRVVPPLAMQNADGSWTGLSVELWKRVAEEIQVPYRIEAFSFADLTDPGPKGIDVVVSLPITARYDKAMEMTHAFHETGLGIATRAETRSALDAVGSKLATPTFWKTVAALLGILVVMGILVWVVERRHKPDEFGGHPVKGIAHGVFWSFESLLGKASGLSKTGQGRALTLLWTFACMLLVSGVTAKLASELTVSQLATSVTGPNDLVRVRVATVKDSTAERYLERRGIDATTFDDAPPALAALEEGRVDAVVYEAPILQYYAAHAYAGRVVVLPGTFHNHGYGLGLRRPAGPLRDKINTAILKIVETDDWKAVLACYLGAAGG